MSLKSDFQINNINLQAILGLIDALPGNGKINISNLESTNSGMAGLKSSFLDNNIDLQKILDFVKALEFDSFSPVFSENSWTDIIAACQNRSVPNTWKVGDSKAMTMDGVDYQIDIIGKNHDVYADGSGVAPLTFQMHGTHNTTRAMNGSTTGNVGSWRESRMRTQRMSEYLILMPIEVQEGIKEVSKQTSVGNMSSAIEATSDKLFLLSEIEVSGGIVYSANGEGAQYTYYKDGNSIIKYDNSGNAISWWLRSPNTENSNQFCMVESTGDLTKRNANNAGFGVSFAFCF